MADLITEYNKAYGQHLDNDVALSLLIDPVLLSLAQDKTAVAKPFPKKQPQWENPRGNWQSDYVPQTAPFESQLQKEAMMRLRDSVPHSGYIEPQFVPNIIGITKGGQEAIKAMRQKLK